MKRFWRWIRDETIPDTRTLYLDGVIAEESWFEDDVTPAGKRSGETLEGLAPHHHRLAHGQRLEALEVGGEVPGKLAVDADHRQVDR